jgi:hypothetical protein
MDDPVSISLEAGSEVILRLRVAPSLRMLRQLGAAEEGGMLVLFGPHPGWSMHLEEASIAL